jgi:hypothetical protein
VPLTIQTITDEFKPRGTFHSLSTPRSSIRPSWPPCDVCWVFVRSWTGLVSAGSINFNLKCPSLISVLISERVSWKVWYTDQALDCGWIRDFRCYSSENIIICYLNNKCICIAINRSILNHDFWYSCNVLNISHKKYPSPFFVGTNKWRL